MLVSDYNYDLPEDRIAKFPPKERGTTRLLVLNRKTGATEDSYYRNLDQYLNKGDVLILNDTRVMQSRLFCTLPDGRERELVVLEKHGDEPQRVMYRGKLHDGDKLFINTKLEMPPSSYSATNGHSDMGGWPSLGDSQQSFNDDGGKCEVGTRPETAGQEVVIIKQILGNGIAEVESNVPLAELAEKYGTVPLPPYLHRDATNDDKKRYQTVWAKHMGSAAAPTASLNMTEDLLNRLQEKGVIVKYLTLHVGLGTFLPMRTDKVEDHHMHSEWFHIPEETIEAIKSIKERQVLAEPVFSDVGLEFSSTSYAGTPAEPSLRDEPVDQMSPAGRRLDTESKLSVYSAPTAFGSVRNIGVENSNQFIHPKKQDSATHPRIIALGTTVARTLEYYARTGKTEGEDDIFIYPGFDFKIVDALITNFHAPKSTVLMLASAFAGWDNLKNAYDHAVKEKYNFLSYGDSMFIC